LATSGAIQNFILGKVLTREGVVIWKEREFAGKDISFSCQSHPLLSPLFGEKGP
jgi:hypothetical protein